MNINEQVLLVAACGLYCGACQKHKKGSCPGCANNEKAGWCKIKVCTREHNYATCAECTEYPDVNDCKRCNNLFAKFFALVFRSDRKASLARISEIGIESYAREMAAAGQPVIKRKWPLAGQLPV